VSRRSRLLVAVRRLSWYITEGITRLEEDMLCGNKPMDLKQMEGL